MAWNHIIQDGHGTRNYAKVGHEGELSVVVHPHPPIDDDVLPLPFRSFFTLDNDGVTTDMRVNGSVTNQHFYIEASSEYNIYIKSISIIIADVNSQLNTFGNITALTNGILFKWSSQEIGDIVLNQALKTNFDFIRMSGNTDCGDGTNAGKYTNLSESSDGYAPCLDYGLKYGIRLTKGTKERLMFTIRDDITGIDAFNAIAYGIEL